MGVFQQVTGWLSRRGSNNAQNSYGGYGSRGYYGSSEAEDAYNRMRGEQSSEMPQESAQAEPGAKTERFGAQAADPYNGRVPYRSQKDIRAEQEARERRAQQDEYQQRMQADQRHRRADTAQQQAYQQQSFQQGYTQGYTQGYPQQNNVVNFPGGEPNAPTHVEYVILLRSRNECTKVIEYIKTNASVFLNMEYIANDGERQRCVDMLSGAAYTLGCQLHKVSNRGIYLIASPYVRVMIDPAMKRYTSSSEAQPFMQSFTGSYPPVTSETGQYAPVAGQNNQGSRPNSEAGAQTSPYSQAYGQTQPSHQQTMYDSFQKQRPSFQGQPAAQQAQRAANDNESYRQSASYQTSL